METETNSESLVLWRGNHILPPFILDKVASEIKHHTHNILISNKDGIEGSIYTTYYMDNIYERPEVLFVDFYREVTKQMVDDLSLEYSITGFHYWCQIYNGSHRNHNHFQANCLLSFVHFLRPVDKNFYFVLGNSEKVYPKQEEGDIIAFPSWALHGIDPSYGDERMVIAGNIEFDSVRIGNSPVTHRITNPKKDTYITETLYDATN